MNKILFFAHLKDLVGEEFVQMDASGKTIAELKDLIAETYGIEVPATVMAAVNEEFARNEEVIKEGDTVAFIPPVSGG
jgi:sulfur-carrier protein